jgi:adenylate cyclase
MAVDWEAEGLLEGLDGEAREARVRLLEALHDDGIDLEELKKAAEDGRLVLLPVERAIEGGEGPRYTVAEVAENAGVDQDFLQRIWAALGAARPEEGEKSFGEEDVEAARQLKLFRDGGMPEDEILEITRVMGQGVSRITDAVTRSFGQAFLRPGDTEHDLAVRYAEATRQMAPLLGETLQHITRLHLRESVRQAAVGLEEVQSGRLPGSQDVAVCFADLVDFTKLGERVAPDELGAVAGKLDVLASEAASPPVRLVKTIGDAAMLVSPDPDALVEAALDLVEGSEARGDDFPLLHAGIAFGPALPRAGDWYGRTVNLASRLSDFARPGSVVSNEELREATERDWSWSFAGKRHFKGIKGDLPVHRVRRAEAGDE